MSAEQDITNIILNISKKHNFTLEESMDVLKEIISVLDWYDEDENKEEFELWFKKQYTDFFNGRQ